MLKVTEVGRMLKVIKAERTLGNFGAGGSLKPPPALHAMNTSEAGGGRVLFHWHQPRPRYCVGQGVVNTDWLDNWKLQC